MRAANNDSLDEVERPAEIVGRVFDIQRFCLQDGPGIRTTVFLKGCPLRCAWCHNPESQRAYVELLWSPSLCIGCGRCVTACRNGDPRELLVSETARGSCRTCLRCGEVCPSGAIELVGRNRTVSEVLAEVLADRVYYGQTGGGMTISGGEPLSQAGFTLALAQAAHQQQVHVCVESCGWGDRQELLDLAEQVDLFLWDLKDSVTERHQRSTGVPLEPILENLRALASSGHKFVLRCPLVYGINADDAHIDFIQHLAQTLPTCQGVELLPCHSSASGKYRQLGRPEPDDCIQPPDSRQVDQWREQLDRALASVSGV